MPVCRECGRVQSSAEMRKLPKGDFKCKDTRSCRDYKPKDTSNHSEDHSTGDWPGNGEAHPYVHRSYGG